MARGSSVQSYRPLLDVSLGVLVGVQVGFSTWQLRPTDKLQLGTGTQQHSCWQEPFGAFVHHKTE